MTKAQSGAIGGLQTFLRYRREQMTAWGNRGGRPMPHGFTELSQSIDPQIYKVCLRENISLFSKLRLNEFKSWKLY